MSQIPEKSPLISAELERQLVDVFVRLTEELELVSIWEEGQKESGEMQGMVEHICTLSPKLSCRTAEKGELSEKADCSLLPLTALYKNGIYTGIAFHGVTGGQELNSLVMAIYHTAGPGQKLIPKLEQRLSELKEQKKIKIFVSLSCHHCAKQVMVCQQIAAKAPGVSAEMIDARLYPELVEQYKIERIPMTVIGKEKIVLGVKTAEEMCQLLLK